MKGSVSADKGKGIAHHADHERDTIGRPTAIVHKSAENIRSGSMRSKSDERDKNGEETKDVQDQDESLKLGQHGADEGVDKDGKQEDCPKEKCTLPQLRFERLVVHGRHSQDHVSRKKGTRRYGSLPSADRKHACEMAKEFGTRPRCHHGDPNTALADDTEFGIQEGRTSGIVLQK